MYKANLEVNRGTSVARRSDSWEGMASRSGQNGSRDHYDGTSDMLSQWESGPSFFSQRGLSRSRADDLVRLIRLVENLPLDDRSSCLLVS